MYLCLTQTNTCQSKSIESIESIESIKTQNLNKKHFTVDVALSNHTISCNLKTKIPHCCYSQLFRFVAGRAAKFKQKKFVNICSIQEKCITLLEGEYLQEHKSKN